MTRVFSVEVPMRRVWFASIVGVLALYVGAAPQAQGGRQGGDSQNPARSQRAGSIADRTAGMQKLDGFFPMYWDEPAGSLYLEIPRLNTEVLYQTGIGAGMGSNDIGLDRGLLVGTRVVSFERVGPKVLMVQPNYDYRAVSDNADERKAVEDAFAKSVIWGFTVAAESDGRVLVDLSDFLMRDATGLGARLQPAAYRFDRTRSAVYLPNTKAFPKNTEIEVTTTLVTDGGGGRGGQGPGPDRRAHRRRRAVDRGDDRAPASFLHRTARRQLQDAEVRPARRLLRRQLRRLLAAVRQRRCGSASSAAIGSRSAIRTPR